MRKWDLSHTVDEKVLMHLWDHSTLADEREAPFEVTQHGIAAAVGIIRSAVPRSVKKLVEKGYIEEKLAHVGRLNRRRKCYFLTKEGRLHSERLRGRVHDASITVDRKKGPREVPIAQLEDFLGRAFDPLEIVMCTDSMGVFDVEGALTRRDQLTDFFTQASQSATAPEDKGTLLSRSAAAGRTAAVRAAPGPAEPGGAAAGAEPGADGAAAPGAGGAPSPPARAGNVILGHPPDLKYFFGRDEELDRLGTWFADGKARVMVVFGLPGVGKSSLGSRFVERLSDGMDDLGLLWSKVHRWDTPHGLVGDIADLLSAIGREEEADRLRRRGSGGPGEQARIIAPCLDGNRLMVWDDLHAAAPDVRDLVGAVFEAMVEGGRGKILILSRAVVPFYDRRHVAVDGLVREMELSGLDMESARNLLELKGHMTAGGAADGLIQASGGHPLYLELFDVRAEDASGPATGAGDDGLALGEVGAGLSRGAGGAGPPRETDLGSHRNVAVFLEEEVYSRLAEPQRLLLERASVFRYPVPRGAFFIDGKADLPSLEDLVRRSIVRESDGVYEMHDVLRSFVYGNIPGERRVRIHSAAARFYDDLLSIVRPTGRTAGRDLVGHREASEVVHHLIQAGDPDSAADFLLTWGPELVRGPYSEGIEGQAEALLGLRGPEALAPDAVAGLRELLGDLYSEQGQLDRALDTYRGLLEEAAGPGTAAGGNGGEGEKKRIPGLGLGSDDLPPSAAAILRKMSVIQERKGDLPTAFGMLEGAEDLVRKVKDVKGHILNLGAMGWLHWRMGDTASSRRCFERSMTHLMKLEELPGKVRELMGQGMEAAWGGDLELALHSFESSMELLEKNEDLFDIVQIYDNIGDQYFKVLVTLSIYGEEGSGGARAEAGEDDPEPIDCDDDRDMDGLDPIEGADGRGMDGPDPEE